MNPETGTPYTREQLKEALSLVENKTNWKMPIHKQVELTNREVDMVRHAVIFYCGCVPTFHPVVGKPGTYLVKAKGYYSAVGS